MCDVDQYSTTVIKETEIRSYILLDSKSQMKYFVSEWVAGDGNYQLLDTLNMFLLDCCINIENWFIWYFVL